MNPETKTPEILSASAPNVQALPVASPQTINQTPAPVQQQALTESNSQEENMLLPQKVLHSLVRPEFVNVLSDWLFRVGFASIFLVNALYAALEPSSFVDLLSTNLVGKLIGHADLLVKMVIINDLVIGIFILFNKYKNIVYIWAGTWLLIVASIKLMNLFS